jgi:hypothetical protein
MARRGAQLATDLLLDELRADLDRAAIRDLMLRYAAGLDRRDFAMVRACFTEDVQAEYSGRVLDPGVDAIIAYVSGLTELRASMHVVANVLVELRGGTASSETYTVAYLVDARDGDEVIHVRGLRYRDELVREDGGWLIRRRVHTPEWMHSARGLPPVMQRDR